MTTVVVDASIALKWLREEEGSEAARALLRDDLVAPPLLRLEVVNVAARRWRWAEEALMELVAQLDRLGLTFDEPPSTGIVRWTARGLTAYDASYVALAEARDCGLVTADVGTLEVARGLAIPLST